MRLIDAIEKEKPYLPVTDYEVGYNNGLVMAQSIAEKLDAVEVVRCKDCKICDFSYPAKPIGEEAIPGWYCKKYRCYRKPDDFCSYGERRSNV